MERLLQSLASMPWPGMARGIAMKGGLPEMQRQWMPYSLNGTPGWGNQLSWQQ